MIAEKQTITINVLDHETPDTIVASVRQGHGEKNAARRELRRQRVRIGHFQIRIPAERRFTAKVRDRFDDDLVAIADRAEGLEHNHRLIAAHNPEKLVLRGWAAKHNFKAQHIAIEGERRRDVSDYEER